MKNLYSALFTATSLLLASSGSAQSYRFAERGPAVNPSIHPVSQHIPGNAQRGGGTPANDDCSGATVQNLTVGNSVVINGDNTGATDAEGYGFASVWEAFTTTSCANVTVELCGTTPAFLDYVWGLGDCSTTEVTQATSNDTCNDGNMTTTYLELPAGTYYIPVLMSTDPSALAVGPYTLTITAVACAAPPTNDECAGAVVLTSSAACVPVAGTTAGATESLPAIPCNGYTSPSAKDVWYSFTATATGHTVTIEGLENFDAVMELFSGDCSDLTSILCGDPTFPNPDPVTEVTPLTGLTVGQTYYLRLYDYAHGSTGHNFNICITTGLPPAQYCVPTEASTTDGDYIANVTLGAINNTTVGDNNYEDYTAQVAVLEQDSTYTLYITSGTYGVDYYAAWIDYNMDTTFQATEKIGEFAGTAPDELIELTFTVPTDAVLGTTRLRVRAAFDAVDMEPCVEYGFGEIEDYHVMITSPTGVRGYNNANVSVYPNPTTGDVTVSAADLNGNVEFELMDMTGRVVFRHQQVMSANQPVTLALNGKLAQGTYTLRLIGVNGISSRPVMVK